MNKVVRIILSFFLFLAIIGIDRLTKWWALTHLTLERQELLPCVSLDLMLNRGIAWGFFHSSPQLVFWLLTALNGMIIIAVAWYAVYCALKHSSIIGHILICAGALANVIDRFMYKGVIDFILLSCKGLAFPVFNIADVSIVIGVGIMLITNYRDL